MLVFVWFSDNLLFSWMKACMGKVMVYDNDDMTRHGQDQRRLCGSLDLNHDGSDL